MGTKYVGLLWQDIGFRLRVSREYGNISYGGG